MRLGDVNNWENWDIDWSSIDLILAGSPCQGFSFAGKQLAFDDKRSALFFRFAEIIEHVKSLNPNVKFLLENVRMKKEFESVITSVVGVDPVMINSALVSAQNRKRLYWANWYFEQPEDKEVLLKDIITTCVSEEYLLKNCHFSWWIKNQEYQEQKKYSQTCNKKDKAITLTARMYANWNGNFINIDECNYSDRCKNQIKKNGKTPAQKSVSVCTNSNITGSGVNCITLDRIHYRKLTPTECERLQTLPDNYTEGVSNSQRYKMLGNGWTVDVIAHILKSLKKEMENEIF